MVWYGMAWHGMAWHGMAWHGMGWYGMYKFMYACIYACMYVAEEEATTVSPSRASGPTRLKLGRKVRDDVATARFRGTCTDPLRDTNRPELLSSSISSSPQHWIVE